MRKTKYRRLQYIIFKNRKKQSVNVSNYEKESRFLSANPDFYKLILEMTQRNMTSMLPGEQF